eukprot:2846757-Pyramimonas_sp.AAC.2
MSLVAAPRWPVALLAMPINGIGYSGTVSSRPPTRSRATVAGKGPGDSRQKAASKVTRAARAQRRPAVDGRLRAAPEFLDFSDPGARAFMDYFCARQPLELANNEWTHGQMGVLPGAGQKGRDPERALRLRQLLRSSSPRRRRLSLGGAALPSGQVCGGLGGSLARSAFCC